MLRTECRMARLEIERCTCMLLPAVWTRVNGGVYWDGNREDCEELAEGGHVLKVKLIRLADGLHVFREKKRTQKLFQGLWLEQEIEIELSFTEIGKIVKTNFWRIPSTCKILSPDAYRPQIFILTTAHSAKKLAYRQNRSRTCSLGYILVSLSVVHCDLQSLLQLFINFSAAYKSCPGG